MNKQLLNLINELIKSISLAQSRGAYKLAEASFIHNILIELQIEIDKEVSKQPLLPVIKEDEDFEDRLLD